MSDDIPYNVIVGYRDPAYTTKKSVTTKDEPSAKLAFLMGRTLYERTGQTRLSTARLGFVPEQVKALGLEREYLRAVYQRSLGYDPTSIIMQTFRPSDRPAISRMIGGSVIESRFASQFVSTYQSLPYRKKASFNIRFFDWSKVPFEDIKYVPGGRRYLEKHKEDIVSSYIESLGGVEKFISSQDIIDIGHKITVYTGSREFLKPSVRSKFAREYAYELLTMDEPIRREFYFSKLPGPARWYSSFFHATVSTALFPVTLAQTGVKYVTGEGELTDVLGRIGTGKTLVMPDVSQSLYRHRPGGPSGAISTLISEGVGYLTGEDSRAGELYQKYPVSGFFATVGEVVGLYVGGKIAHVSKVSAYRGLGYIRKGVMKYTGVDLPSYARISYHFPQRYIRRWWVKRGTQNIDDVLGKPYHDPGTLTPRGLSFAPGKTPGERIQWTVKKAIESREIVYSEGDILLGSAGAGRIGKTFVIKEKTLHELPSLSTTPYGYAPTRFYRFEGSALSYSSGFSLFPKFHLPSGFAIRIERLYAPLRGSYEKIAGIVKGQPKGRWGMVGPKMLKGGPETEIQVFGKTILKRYLPSSDKTLLQRIKGYQFYADVPLEGGKFTEVVPVVFTRVKHKGFPMGFREVVSSKIGPDVREFIGISSSRGLPSTPIINIKYFISTSMAYKSMTGDVSIPSSPSVPSTVLSSLRSIESYSVPSVPSKSIPSSVSTVSSVSIPSSPSVPSSPGYPSSPPVPPPPKIFDFDWPSGIGKKVKPSVALETKKLGYREREWKVAKIESMLDLGKIDKKHLKLKI